MQHHGINFRLKKPQEINTFATCIDQNEIISQWDKGCNLIKSAQYPRD